VTKKGKEAKQKWYWKKNAPPSHLGATGGWGGVGTGGGRKRAEKTGTGGTKWKDGRPASTKNGEKWGLASTVAGNPLKKATRKTDARRGGLPGQKLKRGRTDMEPVGKRARDCRREIPKNKKKGTGDYEGQKTKIPRKKKSHKAGESKRVN